ncbi:MAG: LysR family transcriptional regulator [Myxococcota bacterium]
MRIDHLGDVEVFVTVAELGNLNEGAEQLGLTRKTVQSRIARLETRLGRQLLRRGASDLALTDEGERFVRHGRRILAEVRRAEEALILPEDTVGGTVRVGLCSAVAGPDEAHRIADLLVAHPELNIEVLVSDSPLDLEEHRLDVALTIGPEPDSVFRAHRIAALADTVLAASPAYLADRGTPTEPADLGQHAIIRRVVGGQAESAWTLLDAEQEPHEVVVSGRFASSDARLRHEAIRAGLGIGLVRRPNLERDVDANLLVPVLPGYRFAPVVVSIAYARATPHPNRVDAIVRFLDETLASEGVDDTSMGAA